MKHHETRKIMIVFNKEESTENTIRKERGWIEVQHIKDHEIVAQKSASLTKDEFNEICSTLERLFT